MRIGLFRLLTARQVCLVLLALLHVQQCILNELCSRDHEEGLPDAQQHSRKQALEEPLGTLQGARIISCLMHEACAPERVINQSESQVDAVGCFLSTSMLILNGARCILAF